MAFFQQSRANNSKVTGLIRPEFEPIWDLMLVLVTCKFDKGSINNERASVATSFSHYSLWEIFPVLQGKLHWSEWSNPVGIWTRLGYLQVWRRSEKKWQKRWKHHFPHYKSMGAFGPWNIGHRPTYNLWGQSLYHTDPLSQVWHSSIK